LLLLIADKIAFSKVRLFSFIIVFFH
jgi:hypothetical protein